MHGLELGQLLDGVPNRNGGGLSLGVPADVEVSINVLEGQLLMVFLAVVESHSPRSCWWNWTTSVPPPQAQPPRHRARSIRYPFGTRYVEVIRTGGDTRWRVPVEDTRRKTR